MNTAAAANDNRRPMNHNRSVTIVEPRDRDRKWHGVMHHGESLKGCVVTIVPGRCVTISGVDHTRRAEPTPFFRHFRIGDVAEVGAYNLVYTGVVRAITAKTVTVVEYDGHPGMEKRYVFSIYRFAQKNWNFDQDEAADRNANWMD
jgi:hypothetical protein